MNIKKLIMRLLWAWIPLASGNVLVLDKPVAGTLDVYHILALVLYAVIVALWFRRGRPARLDLLFVGLVVYAFISGLVIAGFTVPLVAHTMALVGIYLFGLEVARCLTPAEFVRVLRSSCMFFLLVTIFFCLLFPHLSRDVHNEQVVYSGFYSQKNSLGLFLTLCFIAFISSYSIMRLTDLQKIINLISIAAAAVLLFLTDSRTSLGAVGAFVCFYVFFGLSKQFGGLRSFRQWLIPSILSGGLLVVFLFGAGVARLAGTGSNHDYLTVFGVTFGMSGRATIWMALMDALSRTHSWLFGFGYGNFFFSDASYFLASIGLGSFIPNDAHNGYLDAVVNVGIVGLSLILLMIVIMFARLNRCDTEARRFWICFLALYLLVNVTESYFVKTTNAFTLLFYVGYNFSRRCQHADIHESKVIIGYKFRHKIGTNALRPGP